MRVLLLSASLFFAFALSPAHAAGVNMVCQKDIEKLCKHALPAVKASGAIGKCLKEKWDEVSDTCKARIKSTPEFKREKSENEGKHKGKKGEGKHELRAACHDDIQQYCSPALKTKEQKLGCLKKNKTKISAGCAAVLGK